MNGARDARNGARTLWRRFSAIALVGSMGLACSSAESPSTYSREKLLDPATCKDCHKKYYAEWSGSMHAYASKDPVFLAMNARGHPAVFRVVSCPRLQASELCEGLILGP